jgi:YqaJ-like viral recombinase domain
MLDIWLDSFPPTPPGIVAADAGDRAKWLEMRGQDVTASVAATLFGAGVHPYISPYQLWALKSGAPIDERTENAAMRRGRLLEPVALQLLAEEQPTWRIAPCKTYYRDPISRIGATPDAFATRPDVDGFGIIQIKTAGHFAFKKSWRDQDGDIALPLWIAVQASVEAALTGASWAAAFAMTLGDGGLEPYLIDVPLRPALMVKLRGLVKDFWRRVAEEDPYEPDWGRDAGLVAALYDGEDGPTIDLSADKEVAGWLDERETLKARESDGAQATKARKLIDAQLISRLGNASGAHVGARKFSVKIVRRGAYSVAATQYPQLSVKGHPVIQAPSPLSLAGPF